MREKPHTQGNTFIFIYFDIYFSSQFLFTRLEIQLYSGTNIGGPYPCRSDNSDMWDEKRENIRCTCVYLLTIAKCSLVLIKSLSLPPYMYSLETSTQPYIFIYIYSYFYMSMNMYSVCVCVCSAFICIHYLREWTHSFICIKYKVDCPHRESLAPVSTSSFFFSFFVDFKSRKAEIFSHG